MVTLQILVLRLGVRVLSSQFSIMVPSSIG
jgi:hypothetical protein